MKYLFLDNFRGFRNTYIPVRDVNFLVGENSTGKTSVLGILRLLSTQRLFLGGEFSEDHVNFGNFKDMVSAHAEDRSYFRIGLIEENTGPESATAILFTYKEREGLPRLDRFTSLNKKTEVSLRFKNSRTLYRTATLQHEVSMEKAVARVMPRWTEEHASESEDYATLKFPKGIPQNARLPLFVLLSWVETANAKREPFSVIPAKSSREVIWIAPIRTKPERTYDDLQMEFTPEGSHTPYVIKKLLHSKAGAERFRNFMSQVGAATGLFQSVEVRSFGRGVTAPFELDIVLDGKALKISTVGYGVSQSLPVFVELITRPKGSWFAIQQPEVHLHPRAQAALGDIFFEMASAENKLFLVETHSDFMIDRFRTNYRKKKSKKPDSQILFFERRNKQNTITPLAIGPRGELPSEQPESYRRFFMNEQMRMLEI